MRENNSIAILAMVAVSRADCARFNAHLMCFAQGDLLTMESTPIE